MLSATYIVLREFLYACRELLLGFPRYLNAILHSQDKRKEFVNITPENIWDEKLPEETFSKLERVWVSCGDQSGQNHAVPIIHLLQAKHPNIKIRGFGGSAMSKAGMDVVLPLADLNIMGFIDVIKKAHLFLYSIYLFARELRLFKPQLVLFIDYPGLNRHLLRCAKRENITTCMYILPQLWAWADWRINDFKKADALLSILPFEATWFKQKGSNCHFIGNPLGDHLPNIKQINHKNTTVAILPGSRKREINANLPLMLKAAQDLYAKKPGITFVLPHTNFKLKKLIETHLNSCSLDIELSFDHWYERLQEVNAAWVVSGTASLEVSALGIPNAIVYHTPSLLFSCIARPAINTPFIGAFNLIAQKELAPEIYGNKLTPQMLTEKMLLLLETNKYKEFQKNAKEIREIFLPPGCSKRVVKYLEKLNHSTNQSVINKLS